MRRRLRRAAQLRARRKAGTPTPRTPTRSCSMGTARTRAARAAAGTSRGHTRRKRVLLPLRTRSPQHTVTAPSHPPGTRCRGGMRRSTRPSAAWSTRHTRHPDTELDLRRQLGKNARQGRVLADRHRPHTSSPRHRRDKCRAPPYTRTMWEMRCSTLRCSCKLQLEHYRRRKRHRDHTLGTWRHTTLMRC